MVIPAPDWEKERIRWGIHSLCQHTIEAVLNLTQGLPPPVWQRRRRPDGQSAFVPTHPPGHSHLGPPRRPPPADSPDSSAPHRGLPDGCSWCPDKWWSTPSSETLCHARGPFSLSLQGVQHSLAADITVCSLNTNGLTTAKLTELLWLRATERIDILILVDTRCSGRQLKFRGKQAREAMGIGSWTHGSPSRALSAKGRPSRHEMVGGQLILVSAKWGRMVRASRADPTGLGVLTEITIGANGGDILLLGTYFPCPSASCTGHSNKLWDKVQAWLGTQGRHQSPQAYLQSQIQDRILRHLGRGVTDGSARRNVALVGGDFNSAWAGHSGPLRGLGGWASSCSLLSPIAALEAPTPVCSYYQGGSPKSLIDHLLLSQPCHGEITRAGVLTGSFFGSVSDHRPVLLGLRLWEGACSAFPSLNALQRPVSRSADLDLSNLPLVQDFQAHLLSSLPAPPANPAEAGEALKQLSIQSASWLASRPMRKGHNTHRRRRFDGWSPGAMALKANLAAVLEIQAHLRGYGGHPLWKTQADMDSHLPPILQAWESTVRDLRWADPADPHRFLDCTGMGPGGWRTASLREISHPLFCTELIRKLRRMLHGRQRLLLRREISAHSARLEALRAEGKIGKVIRSVLQEDSELYALETLSLPGQATLTDHRLIHNAVTEHFYQWYQGPPTPAPPWATLLTDFPLFQAFGRSKRVPDDLLELLWRALTDVPQISQVRDDLAVELALPPSLTEFQAAIQGHRGSTSPGATGLTYNMAKGWPAEVTAFAHKCLILLWDQEDTPAWMQWGWLCPKPKDPEAEITLDGLRPLILLEVVRKLWVGIVVNRITRARERHAALAPAQHGFRPGRGTDTALLQFLNATEHAVEAQLPLYTSSWDIRRAFDSVSREAMEVSWLRLGVPPTVARWLAYMDVGGPTVIRTPWALATWQRHQYDGFRPTLSLDHPATFVRTRGTPQGDVSSPHNWLSFFDIALRALDIDQQESGGTSPSAFRAAGRRGQLYPTGDISYADDLVSTAGSLPGLQRKADILSAFTVLFDMELSPGKLRLAALGPGPSAPRPPGLHRTW